MKSTLLEHQTRAMVGGAVSGGVGGILMLALLVGRSLLNGQDWWVHFKLAAAPYLGAGAVTAGFEWVPVLLGFSAHLFIAQSWGTAFGSICYGMSRLPTLAAGLVLGLVSFVAMNFVMLPILGLHELMPVGSVDGALSLHLLYGAFTAACFLFFQREIDPDTMRKLIEEAEQQNRSRGRQI